MEGYPAMHRPGVEPAISRSQVQHPNHYTNRVTRWIYGKHARDWMKPLPELPLTGVTSWVVVMADNDDVVIAVWWLLECSGSWLAIVGLPLVTLAADGWNAVISNTAKHKHTSFTTTSQNVFNKNWRRVHSFSLELIQLKTVPLKCLSSLCPQKKARALICISQRNIINKSSFNTCLRFLPRNAL